MQDTDIDMRVFARNVGTSVSFAPGSIVFHRGDSGTFMYVIQSGVIEMLIGDVVVETCGENEAIGFMSVIDSSPRATTARVKETCELSIVDHRKFRFMIDHVPNFSLYLMGVMARRIRSMGQII